MSTTSIDAYNLKERVLTYDNDMDLMHPNRRTMVERAVDLVPHNRADKLNFLDLGVGTGFFTHEFLKAFSDAKVVAIDGAQEMISLAKERLSTHQDSVEYRVGNFAAIECLVNKEEKFDVIYSSYAMHHINYEEKMKLINYLVDSLNEGGWILNADLIHPLFPERSHELRIKGIVERSNGQDERFSTYEKANDFVGKLHENEEDQPQPLACDLKILQTSGLSRSDVFWCDLDEALTGGVK